MKINAPTKLIVYLNNFYLYNNFRIETLIIISNFFSIYTIQTNSAFIFKL